MAFTQITTGPPRSDADWEAFTRIEAGAFGTTVAAAAAYVAAVRDAAIARFAFADDAVAGGALALPCEQWFGGRLVPAGAVASVCVAPEWRGGGAGRQVMWDLADAMRRDGLAVSPLFPTTRDFYRGLGWEVVGQAVGYEAPAPGGWGEPPMGGAERDPDPGEVRLLRTEASRDWSGVIERPAWWWAWRMPADPDGAVRIGWREGERLTGFLAYRAEATASEGTGFQVVVTDLWAMTRDALEGLLRVLASERPLSPAVRFAAGVLSQPTPVRRRLDGGLTPTVSRDWMLRVLDPAAALTASGWPVVSGELELEVATLGGPPTPLVVTVVNGVATVREGTAPRVRMSAGAFAAWFAGSAPAVELARLGGASGPDDDLRFMDVLTAPRRPWLPDVF